ncbi:MAG: hypothetical protein PWP08_1574 [Methanofollis sp.]|nr:hypothetical protein [Methanofollis sp.]
MTMEDGVMLVALGEIMVVLLALIGVGVAGCVLYLAIIRGQIDEMLKELSEQHRIARLQDMVGGAPGGPVDLFKLFKHIQKSRELEWEKPPQDVDVVAGRNDIMDSMKTLCEKYYLNAFTIATDDGLVVASSMEDAAADAATYSHAFATGDLPDDPQVMLFGVRHKGSALVGIIRTDHNIPETWVEFMERDAVSILKRWL